MSDINTPQPTLFSKPGCVQCNAVARYFDQHKIPYQKVDITESAQGYALVEQWGYKQVPVVSFDFSHFYGFDPDKLAEIKEAYAPVEEPVAA